MTSSPPQPGAGTHLVLNSPLHAESLHRLLLCATEHDPERIVDHGCGWAEVLLQALALAPGATGRGVDVHAPDLERGTANARERGLDTRVELVLGSSVDHREPADLLISLGAYHAFGDIPAALAALRSDVRRSGRLLFGAEYWAATPSDDELAQMWPGASVDDCLDLASVVDAVHSAGWRIADLHDSTRTEFDDFELGHLLERELWLVEHPDHPVREEVDRAWTRWLRGHRRSMGFVTFVLR